VLRSTCLERGVGLLDLSVVVLLSLFWSCCRRRLRLGLASKIPERIVSRSGGVVIGGLLIGEKRQLVLYLALRMLPCILCLRLCCRAFVALWFRHRGVGLLLVLCLILRGLGRRSRCLDRRSESMIHLGNLGVMH